LAYGAKKATNFNSKFKNYSLTSIGLIISISSALIGIAVIFDLPFILLMSIIVILYPLRSISKGVFSVLTSRYLGNFTNSENITKILAVNSVAHAMGRSAIGFLGSILLLYMSIQYAMLWIGISFCLFILIVSKTIKNKVGLSKEDYESSEFLIG